MTIQPSQAKHVTDEVLGKPPPCNVDFVIPPIISSAAIWEILISEATELIERSPSLSSFVSDRIVMRENFADALGYGIALILQDEYCERSVWHASIVDVLANNSQVLCAAQMDLQAVIARDPAADNLLPPFLYFKGYWGLQAHRIAHVLWNNGEADLALRIQSRVSNVFNMDIHPAACFGVGIMIDHASGIVVGETARVGDYVSMLQGVTLGGTGKDSGDRHPKVECGVLLGAGATVLGNIRLGTCSRIGAGSVVLTEVPPHTTVAGVPAEVVRVRPSEAVAPSLDMNHQLCCKDVSV